jgi:hypothetical protein
MGRRGGEAGDVAAEKVTIVVEQLSLSRCIRVHGVAEGQAVGAFQLVSESCAIPIHHLVSATARMMASADRSMSSSVVDQFETEIRIAALPCHTVPPNQQVPSF